LRESRIIIFYLQQLGKEFEKTEKEEEKEGVVKELIRIVVEWKQIKDILVEAAVHTVGYQPKSDKRRWLDEEYSIEKVD
jgi:hypothetical protein